MNIDFATMSQPSFVKFTNDAPSPVVGPSRWLARGQNFIVEWIEATGADQRATVSSQSEIIVLPLGAEVTLDRGSEATRAPARSVCICPAGVLRLRLTMGGRCAVLSSSRSDLDPVQALNAARYAAPDPRVASNHPDWARRRGGQTIDVFLVDQIKAPATNPRLKMFQSSTMSINWAEYQGPRDRRLLSPHSHSSFEQGSLAVEGDFVHHLRWPWSNDSTQWRDDAHVQLGSPSLMVVPPEVIHTTEGVDDGHHLLVDVFSPPRRDFIEKNWVTNSDNYWVPTGG